MKKTLLVLLAVLAISLTSYAKGPLATSYSYAFDGFCDGVGLLVTNFDGTGTVGPNGVPQVLIGGFHDFKSACGGLLYNGTIVGLVHNLAMNIPPHYGTTGKVFDLADNGADATGFPSPNFTGIQLQYLIDPTTNQWALYVGFLDDPSEGTYLVNFGTVTPGITAHQAPGANKTSLGQFKAVATHK